MVAVVGLSKGVWLVAELLDVLAEERVFGDSAQSLEARSLEGEVDLWQEILSSSDRKVFVDEA